MPISNSDILKIIEHFLPGDPLSYKLYDDGSLVVIAATGKKHTFSADQVSAVHNFMKPDPGAALSSPKQSERDSRNRGIPTSREVGPAASKTVSKPKSTT